MSNNKKKKKSKNKKMPCLIRENTGDWQEKFRNMESKSNDSPFINNQMDIDTAVNLINENSLNENQFRQLKPIIFYFICILIAIQLIITNSVTLIVIISSVVDKNGWWFINNIKSTYIPYIFDFLKYFLSVTIVELLAMLFFIIKSVYNKSILQMLKIIGKKK